MTIETALSVIGEQGYIQDIGQLTAIRRPLDKLVKQGLLRKDRIPWLGYLGSPKTTYLLP